MTIPARPRPWSGWFHRPDPIAADGTSLTHSRRIYILPTRMGLAFAVMLFVTLLGSLNYQNNLGLLMTFLMIAIALVSMHHCWFTLLGLRIGAQGAGAVFLGEPAVFTVTVTETRGSPRGEICVRDGDCGPIPARGQLRLRLALPTRRRGSFELGAVTLLTRHPLGLFQAWTRAPLRASLLVYPHPAAQAAHPTERDAPEHAARGDRGRGADDYTGPRRYQPGDSPRRLDWKALARERGLLVKQFGGDHSARVWLDWEQVSGGTEARLSQLTRQLLEADANQLTYGLRLPTLTLAPGRFDAHRQRCLEALARFGEPPVAARDHGH